MEYTPQLCTSTTSPYIEHLSEYINILPKNMYNLIRHIGESQCFVKKKEILAFGLVRNLLQLCFYDLNHIHTHINTIVLLRGISSAV